MGEARATTGRSRLRRHAPHPRAAVSGLRRRGVDALVELVGSRARLRVALLLAAVLSLSSADGATIGAIAPKLEPALHIDNAGLGLLSTVSSVVALVVTLPWGVAADRVSRVRLLTLSVAVWSVAEAGGGLAGSLLTLLVARAALGVALGAAAPAVASLIGDYVPQEDRGRVYGVILSGELIGSGLGFVVSGDVASASSWRVPFFVLSVPGLVLAAALFKWLPEPPRGGRRSRPVGVPKGATSSGGNRAGPDGHPAGVGRLVSARRIRPRRGMTLDAGGEGMPILAVVRYVLRIRSNVVFIVASALGYFFFAGVRTFGVVFVRQQYGISEPTAVALLVLVGAGAFVATLLSGRISARLLQRGVISANPTVAAVAFLFSAACFLPGLLVHSVLVATPLFLGAAAGLGAANPPLDAARLDIMPPPLWGRAEGVRTVLRDGLEAAAPLLFGWVADQLGGSGGANDHGGLSSGHGAAGGLGDTFLIMLVPLAASGLMLLYARRTYPTDVATAEAARPG